MINKELLSEVLGIEIIDIGITSFYEIDKIKYFIPNPNYDGFKLPKLINIYELSYKCKEWASNKDFTILSGLKYGRGYAHILEFRMCNYQTDTEPEAIFKTCEWILNNSQKIDKRIKNDK